MTGAVATSAGGTKVNCGASAYADYYTYPEGDAAIIYGATTSCDRYVEISGTASLTPNPGSTPVASDSFHELVAMSGTAYDVYVTVPGASFTLGYTNSITAPFGFSWTTIPSGCTVVSRKITCTMSTPFTVS